MLTAPPLLLNNKQMSNSIHKNITVGLVALLIVGGAFGSGVYSAVRLNGTALPAAAAQSTSVINLDPSELIAKSAVVYDLRTTRVLYQKDAYEQLPLASLTKLMAVEVVLNKKDPTDLVELTSTDLKPEGDSGLRVGQAITIGDLIRLALVASSNDAITAAARSLGDNYIGQMNDEAKNLGLTQTHFFNPTGLDINTRTSGAYGSAYDVARLASLFYNKHSNFFELTTKPEVMVDAVGREIVQHATTEPLQSIHGFVAAKTGYTDLAGGNLVAIFDLQPGLTVAAVVLGSTRDGRFEDIKKLIEAARASL